MHQCQMKRSKIRAGGKDLNGKLGGRLCNWGIVSRFLRKLRNISMNLR